MSKKLPNMFNGEPPDDLKLAKSGYTFKATKRRSKNVLMTIKGLASTEEVDSYNEIVRLEAFGEEMMDKFMEHPLLLFNHMWFDKPIGKITDWEITDEGLGVTAEIFNTVEGRDIAVLIEEKILNSFSIGFSASKIIRKTGDEEDEPDEIVKLRLFETSVVNLGANEPSLFSQVKSDNILEMIEEKGITLKAFKPLLEKQTEETNDNPTKGSRKTIMAGTTAEFKDAVGRLESSHTEIGEKVDQAAKTTKELEAKGVELGKKVDLVLGQVEKLQNGQINDGEYKEFCGKISKDVVALQEEIRTANNANEQRKTRYGINDWKTKMSSLRSNLRDDSGVPLSDFAQKCHFMFNEPVDYKSHSEGELLRGIRDAYDTYVFSSAIARFRGFTDPRNLKSYQDLVTLTGYFDPEFSKALNTGTATLGGDYVPTGLGSEVHELLRLEPRMMNQLPNFDMPTNPYHWPLLTAGATAYLADEATVDNPAELTKSNIATNKVIFSTKTIATHVRTSPELMEDSIVAIVPLLRQEIVRGESEGMEAALMNGDTTSPHGDTDPAYVSPSVEVAWIGFRHMAIDDSATFDTQSTSAGVGDAAATFAAKDVRYLRSIMGVGGIDPSKLLFACNIDTWFLMLSFAEVTKANEFGTASTWLTGTLPALDGVEIYISTKLSKDLDTVGLDTSTAPDHSSILCIHKPSFMIGSRRGVTVEFQKNIFTQQLGFVATMRKDFKKLAPSTEKAVTAGHNIETP